MFSRIARYLGRGPALNDANSPDAEHLMSSASTPAVHGFSYWVGVAFCVNYIMGCGFLAIPHRFFGSGVLLGPLVVVAFCVIMNVSKDYMLEAMGRAEAIANAEDIIARIEGERRGDGFGRSRSGSDASVSTTASGSGTGSSPIIVPAPHDYLVSHTRRFEVADLFAVLLGNRARVTYVFILSGYMYGALWAYGTVFASSFAANVGLPGLHGGAVCTGKAETCIDLFLAWLAVFAFVAIPLACLELREQVWVQVVMFGARILVVFLMVSTIMHGWSSCAHDAVVFAADTSTASAAPAIFGGSPAPNVPLADVTGISALLPVATYAFIFHHSVPVLATPIARKDTLPSLFRSAFLVCAVAYGALGLIVALGFGAATNGQCNLDWAGYVGCVASGGSSVTANDASATAKFIRFVVLIFPAVDVLSAYPLNAITLGNNLMCAVLGDSAAAILAEGGEGVARRAPTADAPWFLRTHWSRIAMRTLFRLLAAFPPIVAGALSASSGIDLDAILRWTGLIGVAIAFAIPSLLRAVSFARTRAVFKILADERASARDEHDVTDEGSLLAPSGPSSSRASSSDELIPSRRVARALREPLSWRDVCFSSGDDALEAALRNTPYTSVAVAKDWGGGVRGDTAMGVFSVAAAIFIFYGLVTTKV